MGHRMLTEIKTPEVLIQEKVYFCRYNNLEYVKYQDNNKSA